MMRYNILLQSNLKTINALLINKTAYSIYLDRQFWVDKLTQHHMQLLLNDFIHESDGMTYLELYDMALIEIENATNILKINKIEKNRKYNKTNGIFKILINDNKLLHEFSDIHVQVKTIIFKLLNNEYELSFEHDAGVINLGKYTLNQVSIMLPLLLYQGECVDEHRFDFIHTKNDDYYNHMIDPYTKVWYIRRGMWEIINDI